MSYCRWSTNDFQCDLYCYEDISGRFYTHVGSRRAHYKAPLPEVVDFIFDFENEKEREEWAQKYLDRHNLVMKLHEQADFVKIGLPSDGETYCDETLEEFLDTLERLKEEGYIFPDYVIEKVKEEIKEKNEECPDETTRD